MDKKANANKLISSMVALTLATTLGVPTAALADTGDKTGSLAANSESQPASGDVAGAYAASQQGTDESQPAPQDKSVAPPSRLLTILSRDKELLARLRRSCPNLKASPK